MYEVGLDGEVVRLRDIDGPAGKKREKGKGKADEAKEPAKEAVPAAAQAEKAAPAVETPAAPEVPVEEKKAEEPVRFFLNFFLNLLISPLCRLLSGLNRLQHLSHLCSRRLPPSLRSSRRLSKLDSQEQRRSPSS